MRGSQKRIPLPILLLSLLLLSLRTSQVAGAVYTVDGYQIEVRLVPEQPTIMLGEPIHLSFIVQNRSDQDLQVLVGGDYRNRLGRPESFTVTVTRSDGEPVRQPDAGMGMGGLLGPQKIPAQGSYAFRLFLPHWAVFEEPGNYSIVAQRTLKLSRYTPGRWDSQEKTTDVRAQADTRIRIIPQDSKKMGELIARLGETMLHGRPAEAESAAYTLSYVQDERVVPHFVEALQTNDYNRKFTAIQALSQFKDERAFQALKAAMKTKGADIGNTTTRQVADQLANNIRHAAAAALARSPHPQAVPFLLSIRNDSSEAVRMTVLHVVGKMEPRQAIPILREMTHDESRLVRDEAKRYLGLLSARE